MCFLQISFPFKQPRHLITPLLNCLPFSIQQKILQTSKILGCTNLFLPAYLYILSVHVFFHFARLFFSCKLKYYYYPVCHTGGELSMRWSLKCLWLLNCWHRTVIATISKQVFLQPFYSSPPGMKQAAVHPTSPDYYRLSL